MFHLRYGDRKLYPDTPCLEWKGLNNRQLNVGSSSERMYRANHECELGLALVAEIAIPPLLSPRGYLPVNSDISGQAARPISTGQLHTLQCFHLRPINLIVYKGPLGSYDRDT